MITMHSVKRTKERAGLNERAAIRMIINAYERGLDYDQFNASERDYLEKRTQDGQYAKYYSGYCFIFNEADVCVTMYKVPTWFGKSQYNGKIKIKNPKIYYRNHPIEDNREELLYWAV